MPESKGRRKGQHGPARERRRRRPSGTTGASHSSPGSTGLGRRPRIRPKTWRKIRRWGFITLAGVIAIVVIGSFAVQGFPTGLGGGGGQSQAVVGVGTPVSIVGGSHVPVGETVSYTTTPPTSGPHWVTPARCGIYDEELEDEIIVHNLEHGNVVISYNITDPEEAERFREMADKLPGREVWGVVRPYSKLVPGTVAMTAWGIIDEMQGVDEERIRRFFDTYSGYQGAPELEPCNR